MEFDEDEKKKTQGLKPNQTKPQKGHQRTELNQPEQSFRMVWDEEENKLLWALFVLLN